VITEIVPLHQVTDTSMGGKAYGLSRLLAMGLPVPAAFVIRNARSDVPLPELEQHYRALGGRKVAVRSSALGEDGSDASFAGQYDTVLNVAGLQALQRAIDHCVASAGSERARRYQLEQAQGGEAAMNVVVQCMVDARVAGVVFTADPVSARRDLLLIDAVAGLGEALVSGEATPDHYAVHSSGSIVRRQLVGALALLTDSEISAIATQARAAAAREGQPLDLEWAIDRAGRPVLSPRCRLT
jgi:pyruvate,water dikinase